MIDTSRTVGTFVIGVVLALSACAPAPPNAQSAPESAFRAFRSALARGDSQTVWAFLGPETRAGLEDRAVALGSDNPEQLLVAGWVPMEAEIDTVERLEYGDDEAVLRMTTVLGYSADVTLHRIDDGWRVELALPHDEPQENR